MPLLHFHMYEGRTDEQVKTLLDAAHEAMLEAFAVPAADRYQLVSEYKPSRMIVEDTGLDIPRTKDMVLVQMFSRPRGAEKNALFYKLLVEALDKACGIKATDVMISVVENEDAHWSFGHGRAQFLTGELGGHKAP
ncbi:4-oxalocrotonate tautomerase [Ameyamaea chiangmaiensis NBRC 103196]|uniref:Tautomerase family protein n=1 Tax=Ameyamaea chiangmaiensis TaxID=442969 RepID=A0A850PCT9_9PROT|nr:tautomerase family protein [Ameyamaea chiangmaiensis]MBS4076426.1 tautomerase family protein [Ameyamaea chiangmaiensis]NVN41798.1 tautomerase family protein [Ameyamaea chiangmaiensis]GBQ61838.1 4-oxalocrotonate tautomerase [Ameyamaea chiangmaiensis NBRC 103196]